MTWAELLNAYLLLGAVTILATKARREVLGALSPAERHRGPGWKVAAFYLTVVPTALLFWPLFLPSWLGKKETVWDKLQHASRESGLGDIMNAMNQLAETGCDTDEIPEAEGEFGYDASNPIPTNTIMGSRSYLGRLRTPDGKRISFERIGSYGTAASPYPADGYELTDESGNSLGTIYISPYHRRTSGKPPAALVLVD